MCAGYPQGHPQIIHKNRLNPDIDDLPWPGQEVPSPRRLRRRGTSSIWIRRKWGIYYIIYGNIMEYPEVGRKMFKTAILLRNVAILLGYPTLGNAKNVTNPASDGLTFQKSRSNQGYDILFQKKIVRMATDGYSIRRLSVLNNSWIDNCEPTICEHHPVARQFSANEPREYDIEREREILLCRWIHTTKSRHVQLSDPLFCSRCTLKVCLKGTLQSCVSTVFLEGNKCGCFQWLYLYSL